MMRLLGLVAKVIGGFVMLMVVFAFIAVKEEKSRNNSAPTAVAAGTATTTMPLEPAVVAPALAAQVRTVVKAYNANEVAADNVYKGKRIRVIGEVRNIGKDVLDRPYLAFGEAFSGLNCYFGKEHAGELATMSKGDLVVVDGDCRGLTVGRVVLNDCSLPALEDVQAQTPDILPKSQRPKKK